MSQSRADLLSYSGTQTPGASEKDAKSATKLGRRGAPRRRDLPNHIRDYSEQLLRELCEVYGWNISDLADEVEDAYRDIDNRLQHYGIEPDPRKSPRENLAAELWQHDPEDYHYWGDSE